MKKYKVFVKRVSYSVCEIEVDADSKETAEEIALNKAGSLEFSESDSEYLSEGVMEMESGEDEFWEIIEKVNWKKDHDYNRIEKELSVLPEDFRKRFSQFCYGKLKELSKRFDEDWVMHGSEGIAVSDDGWYDLRADVIGRGKKFYYSITKSKLQKMALDYDYEENFLYGVR